MLDTDVFADVSGLMLIIRKKNVSRSVYGIEKKPTKIQFL